MTEKNSIENALLNVHINVTIRQQVSYVLTDILADVETQHYISAELNHALKVEQLDSQIQVLKDEVAERRAVSIAEQAERIELADRIVGELWALSVQLEQMEKWQEENGHKVQDYNNLQVELRRQEEVVRSLRRQASLSGNANRDPAELASMNNNALLSMSNNGAMDTDTKADDDNVLREALAIVTENDDASSSVQQIGENSNVDDSGEVVVDQSSLAIKASNEQTNDHNEASPSSSLLDVKQSVSSPTTATAVANKYDEPPNKQEEYVNKEEEVKLGLKSLEEKNLLDVFSFLDALDVLNAAQVDKEFYIRVDMLFGIGSSVVSASSVNASKASANTSATKANKTAAAAASISSSEPASVHEPSPSKTTAFLKSLVVPKAKPPSPTASGAISHSSTTAQVQPLTQRHTPLLSYVSSIMQKQTDSVAAPVKSSPARTTADVASALKLSSPDDKQQQHAGGASQFSKALQSQSHQRTSGVEAAAGFGGLTASMADSMADKLTPTELAVIISMTEKLRQRDKDIKRLTAEREDLAARLEGTEAVKEFLIGKVQKTEAELKKSADAAVLVGQQTASDQEVIAFLDGRVQELERTGKKTLETKNKLDLLLKQTRDQNDKRQKVLEDMLQFERQQLAEQEKEWRSTKKVLVKEVKHCHAQIATLKAERDSFQQQNQQLKQALLKRNGTKSIK
mmetsp:Transcript_8222/g.12233  ORF Transcript_8222/g.12233 Transcript_8222/m.12233 type:complete len:687 (-) Transcript_8222:125-2185(-)